MKNILYYFNKYWLLLLLLSAGSGWAQPKPSFLNYEFKQFNSNGIYKIEDRRIGFFLRVKNNIRESQRGTITLELVNGMGKAIHKEDVGLFVRELGSFLKDFNFDKSKLAPDFYTANIFINTNITRDTLMYSFGVDPQKIPPTVNRPADFATFWGDAKRELANINPGFRITKRGDKGNARVDVYAVEFQSLDNATIRGWLSVPVSKRNFPVLYQISGYMNSLEPNLRTDIAVLSLNVRGNGNSESPYKTDYNNYLTYNLNSKNKYIYRGAYMDALRGLEFIYKSTDLRLDAANVILYGEGQGATIAAAVAAMDNRVKGLIFERPLFVDMRSQFNMWEGRPYTGWPVYVFQDYMNKYKLSKQQFLNIYDYFDAQSFAIDIHCSTLVATSLLSTYSPAQTAYNFYNQLTVIKRETYVESNGEGGMGKKYYAFQNQWIKEVLRQKK
ncbi:MAG: acetylxylan esterase [Chitinophagaceae bacterium]